MEQGLLAITTEEVIENETAEGKKEDDGGPDKLLANLPGFVEYVDDGQHVEDEK